MVTTAANPPRVVLAIATLLCLGLVAAGGFYWTLTGEAAAYSQALSVLCILGLGIAAGIVALLKSLPKRSVGRSYKGLPLRWSTAVSRPWPLDVSEGSVLSACPFRYPDGRGDIPRDLWRKGISLWDLGSGAHRVMFQTSSNVNAARGSFSASSKGDVMVGNEIWSLHEEENKGTRAIASREEGMTRDAQNDVAKCAKDVISRSAHISSIAKTDLKNHFTLYTDDQGRKRVLALRWHTEWCSREREYHSRKVSVGLYSGESGNFVDRVFEADWSDSRQQIFPIPDGKLRPAETKDRKEWSSIEEKTERYPDFARLKCRLSPDRRFLAVHARDRKRGNRMTMHVWGVDTGELMADLAPENKPKAWCNLLRWAPNSDVLATSYIQHQGVPIDPITGGFVPGQTVQGFIRLWQVSTGECWKLPMKDRNLFNRVAAMTFLRHGLLAIGGFDGHITIIDIRSGEASYRVHAFNGAIQELPSLQTEPTFLRREHQEGAALTHATGGLI
eukprot:CAMPEP_0114513486 /NCGR_PEP_ID=MMETSP0109-20121206/15599_1 /TAXON_ID=29199 /ORGANISM="Chlorarachnion reptans, Strain CCCM449" /LENGTH=501 /DNA_ID=CAMNT_0001693369 /DNA_START=107 /DNA_END=1613 /DNA_ORIENTATION=+